jgi:hypothetical protein
MTETEIPYDNVYRGVEKPIDVLCNTAASSFARAARNWHRMASDAERDIEILNRTEVSRETGYGLNEIKAHTDRINQLRSVAESAMDNREAAFDAADALLKIGNILKDMVK